MDKNEIKQLRITAYEMRKKVLRMCDAHQAGHLGGAFSCIDMVAALYFHTMNVNPQDPKMEDRDRFVLSAGHKCLAQYPVLRVSGWELSAVRTDGMPKKRRLPSFFRPGKV